MTVFFFRAWLGHVAVLILKPLHLSPYRLAEAVAAGAADVRKHQDDHSGMRAIGFLSARATGTHHVGSSLRFAFSRATLPFFVASYLYPAG
jgi:hypothetical protein